MTVIPFECARTLKEFRRSLRARCIMKGGEASFIIFRSM